mgnify:CR=1 FL=1
MDLEIIVVGWGVEAGAKNYSTPLPRGFEREGERGREIENRERETDTNWRETSSIPFMPHGWGLHIYKR